MSIWTSRAAAPVLLPVLLLAALAGCGAPGGDAVTRVAVAGGAVTLAAPRGYCVDRSALRDTGREAFALFGSCAALAPGPFAPAPRPLAVLSAAVAAPRDGAAPQLAGSEERMRAFFTSQAGRRALSRGHDPASVTILRTWAADGVFFIHLRDDAANGGPRVAPEYWRAILVVNQRMVTLSVLALENAPLDAAEGESILETFVARLGAANTGSAAPR